ncbi:MAG TPA: hypothetical protein VLF19_09395 [Methylomirabilota bacterium]|nr:hypothetical protein [Methylomirabilota bacterium]
MNAWWIIAAVPVLALLYVLIPVGLAARGRFRSHKLVRCPILGLGAGVLIRRAGLAEALGWRSLRYVSDCTYWPRRRACAQRCRLAPDEEIRDFRQPVV